VTVDLEIDRGLFASIALNLVLDRLSLVVDRGVRPISRNPATFGVIHGQFGKSPFQLRVQKRTEY